jgi:AraC-like DNA-binding protein
MSGYRATPQMLLVGGGDVADVLSKLETEYGAQAAFCKQFMNAYLSLLVAFLYRYELLLPHDTLATSVLEPLLPVLHFLHERLSDSSLTLDAICEATNYDKFYLCRLFKKITGGTVFQYLNYLRVAVAADLLAEGGKTVTQVALECGFSSVQYFNRVFKKERGCTPSVYKQLTK